jgi:hypothetical protein
MNNCKNVFALLIAGVFLTACGGGGTDISGGSSSSSGSSSSTTTTTVGAAKYITAATPSPVFQPLINGTSSKIVFTVTDVSGNAVSGKVVDFAFSSSTAASTGYALSASQLTTDSSGLATVYVSSGTAPETLYVKATLHDDSSVTTLSSSVSFGMGVPDSNSFSISADVHSLDAAATTNGVTSSITVYAADKFNHAALDGTKIYAQSSGGQIIGDSSDSGATPFCTTASGTCTLKLVSAAPRPADGTVNVIFYADGEESFVDDNNDGVMNASEFNVGDFDDIGEPYIDADASSSYTSGELYWDLDGSGGYTAADGKYHGLACDSSLVTAGSCVLGTVKVWQQQDFVFSSVNDIYSHLEVWNGVTWDNASSIDATTQHFYRILLASTDNTDNAIMALPSKSAISFTSTNGGTPIYGKPTGYNLGSSDSTLTTTEQVRIDFSRDVSFSSTYPSNAIKPFFYYFTVPTETTSNSLTTGTLTIKVTSPASNAANPVTYTVTD